MKQRVVIHPKRTLAIDLSEIVEVQLSYQALEAVVAEVLRERL